MTGQIAQACRFTSFGNAYLWGRAHNQDQFGFAPQHVHALRFVVEARVFGIARTRVVARSAADWFAALRRAGTKQLALLHSPNAVDPQSRPALAAFAGGAGAWVVASHEDARTLLWASTWRLADVPRGTGSPWDVVYAARRAPAMPPPAVPDLAAVSEAFGAALGDAIAFAAEEPALASWTAWFERARAALVAAQPESILEPHVAPVLATAIHSLAARRLVAAAQSAWVFGGMMSWNDYSATDATQQARYADVTAALYARAIDAIVAGVNAIR